MSNNDNGSSTGEGIKFLLLVIILGVVLVVMALLRPIIFERIVPAVLGMNREGTPTTIPVVDPPVTVVPAETVAPAETPPVIPTATTPPTPLPPAPTPVPSVQYTVRPGDNLIKIAQQFGVTVEAIRQANGITNPNYVQVGTVLTIPQP